MPSNGGLFTFFRMLTFRAAAKPVIGLIYIGYWVLQVCRPRKIRCWISHNDLHDKGVGRWKFL